MRLSNYILDSNGDTQIILNTCKDQPFIWEAETVYTDQDRSTKKCLERNEEKKIKDKATYHPPPMPPSPPPTPKSPVLIPTSFRQPIVSFTNIAYSGPDFSDEETTRSDSTDAKGNANNSSLQLQDWDYRKDLESCLIR